ncbi:MAG: ABC transporter ATP-binding protein/permease [Ignavibacteriales bacterium]|nr:ABC transporter ATP-binding protein/permease [Melioribacteraceae bacterium]MCF8315138.1 ABC transporter ATP-binding protein/permease [Ignavibacteriales bacterium]MCF8435866.1 ABC transporter ATP-binding protein/permease [Ignavibacteriales bacterium]
MKKAIIQLYYLLEKSEKRTLKLLFIMMIIGSLFEIVGIGAIPAFLGFLMNPEKISQYEIVNDLIKYFSIEGTNELLLWSCGFLVIIYFIKNLFLSFLYYQKSKFIYTIKKRFEIALFEKYLKAPYLFHLETNSSSLIRNVTQEIPHIIVNFLLPILQVVLDLILLIIIIATLIYVNPTITLVVGSSIGLLSLFFLSMVKKKLKRYGKMALDHRTLLLKHLNQAIGAIKEIIVIANESFFMKKFSFSADRNAVAMRFRQTTSLLPKPFLELMMVVGLVAITFVLFSQGQTTEVIIPTIALYGIALIRLLPVISAMITNYASIRYNYVSVEPVYDHLMNIITRRRTEDKKNVDYEDYELNIADLCFQYPNTNKKVLEKVSFKIKKGEVIGFVGYTGSGKTTLVDILLGLLPSDSESISLHNKKYKSISEIFNGKVGYIPQTIFLIDDSIKNNIAFGVDEDEINEDLIQHVLELAQLKEFIQELESGIETMIGERGVRISGGQRQRIGIARALYFQPEILIMDEATSSLDNQTEKYFIDAIQSLRRNMTILIIAHRLTTIEYCDRIYFISDGKIIAQGDYEYLLSNSKEFKQLVASN